MKIPFLRWLFYTALGCCIPSALPAQESFSCRTIGINQGLSQSSVMDVAFDSLGFAWFATQDGLNRYDGRNFLIEPRTFDDITTPVSSRLGKIVAGRKGALWLITSGGTLEKRDLPTQHVQSFSSLPPVNCVYEDKNGLCWAGTESHGIYLLNAPQNHPPIPSLPSPSVIQIAQDADGCYWALTRNGLVRFGTPGSKPHTYLQTTTPTQAITCSAFSQDPSGNYWLGTYGHGLYCMRNNDTCFRPFITTAPAPSPASVTIPPDLIILSLLADHAGNVWIGTYGNGLFRIDPQHQLHQYRSDKKDPFSLPYNDILCLKEDPNGGIWIGTDGGGVAQYNTRFNNFAILSRDNVPAFMPIEQVRAICTDRTGGIWIGTSNNGLGYSKNDLSGFRSFSIPAAERQTGNYQRIVSLLTDHDDDIWVGTQGNGCILLDHKGRLKPLSHVPDHTIWCMLPDAGNRVWIGTRNGGLCLLDKQKGPIAVFDTTASLPRQLPENNIRALTRIDDTTLCIGLDKKGICFVNTRSLQVTHQHALTNSPILLKCLYVHAPCLYIGTQGKGLCIYNLSNDSSVWITEKDGLPNNTIYGILEDDSSRLWMCTNKGITMTPLPDPKNPVNSLHFSIFTREDGLQGNEFNTGAWHKGADGRLFFGGIGGITLFYPHHLSLAGAQPRVAITGIMINNKPPSGDTAIPYRHELDLPYSDNSLSFNFAALDFLTNNKIAYFYRLQPYETQWVPAGNRGYTAYTNLAPGEYTFQVKANSPFSEAAQPVTSLTIVIHPPFWKTAWFIIACIISGLFLLYAIIRYRISQLLKVQTIRNHIATDLHDDIGSTLTNISLLSELTRKNQEKGENTTPFLDRIAEEVQRSSQALDDIVWSINTNNDSMEQVVARMRRYASEIFDGADIRYDFKADVPDTQKRLNIEQRRDCFLVFKEIINNIYKHAEATHARITIITRAGSLDITVTDNGKGFSPAAITHRNGLKNIRQRVEKWKGKLNISSNPGTGSTIAIRIPLR